MSHPAQMAMKSISQLVPSSLESSTASGVEGVRGLDREDRPPLRTRIIERTAIVRFRGLEPPAEAETLRSVGRMLDRLVESRGPVRLVLNFAGVRYLSAAALVQISDLATRTCPDGGAIQVCGLEPNLLEMFLVSPASGVFDICVDEGQALGLIIV